VARRHSKYDPLALVSFDSEIRQRPGMGIMRISESGHQLHTFEMAPPIQSAGLFSISKSKSLGNEVLRNSGIQQRRKSVAHLPPAPRQ
jgi:hypothetical protein